MAHDFANVSKISSSRPLQSFKAALGDKVCSILQILLYTLSKDSHCFTGLHSRAISSKTNHHICIFSKKLQIDLNKSNGWTAEHLVKVLFIMRVMNESQSLSAPESMCDLLSMIKLGRDLKLQIPSVRKI